MPGRAANAAAFRGAIDLVAMTALTWDAGEREPRCAAIPPERLAEAKDWRRTLEAIVEEDEAALATYLEDENAPGERAIKALMIAG